MALTANFSADVAFAVADLGDTFTWSGNAFATSYACVISMRNATRDLGDLAGYMAGFDAEIVVQTSLFTGARPRANQTVKFDSGQQYRIMRVETDEADAALNIWVNEFTA